MDKDKDRRDANAHWAVDVNRKARGEYILGLFVLWYLLWSKSVDHAMVVVRELVHSF